MAKQFSTLIPLIHVRRSEDRRMLQNMAETDAHSWFFAVIDTKNAFRVDVVQAAATKAFFARVNRAASTNIFVDDRALGRALYEYYYTDWIAEILRLRDERAKQDEVQT